MGPIEGPVTSDLGIGAVEVDVPSAPGGRRGILAHLSKSPRFKPECALLAARRSFKLFLVLISIITVGLVIVIFVLLRIVLIFRIFVVIIINFFTLVLIDITILRFRLLFHDLLPPHHNTWRLQATISSFPERTAGDSRPTRKSRAEC
jgi:hypothetical protein